MEYAIGAAFGFLAGTVVMWLAARGVILELRDKYANLEAVWKEARRNIFELRSQIAPFDRDGDGRIGGSKRR